VPARGTHPVAEAVTIAAVEKQERFADAVVVAAGSSRRMGGVDKLDQEIDGRSVLQRSVEALASARHVRNVIVVASAERHAELSSRSWLLHRDAWKVVVGGARRQDSVAAGVLVTSADVVLVHDAARPLVSADLVDAVAVAAREHGAAIPVVPVVDSLRRVEGGVVTGSVGREALRAAQTPQGALRDLLSRALERHAGGSDTFTDEAELLARDGVRVAVVDGEVTNIKVTLPADLELARALANAAAGRSATAAAAVTASRVGFGEDVHPFGTDLGLRIGGIEIPSAPRLHGHSDGDAVLHSVANALLGAAGLADIGHLFPPEAKASRGIDSSRIVSRALEEAAAAGWRPVAVSVTVAGARPKYGSARLRAMAEALAGLLGLAAEAVSVHAISGNLSGDEGAGRVIRATAAVTTEPR
jgi:2-C-methyl-D-erythritol 4-phosphate cytidylyltransferase / 2-C-methyl-D-erythritol 2,4-cyclodiphosphate synthase